MISHLAITCTLVSGLLMGGSEKRSADIVWYSTHQQTGFIIGIIDLIGN